MPQENRDVQSLFLESNNLAFNLVGLAGGKPDLKPNKAMVPVQRLTGTLGSAEEDFFQGKPENTRLTPIL